MTKTRRDMADELNVSYHLLRHYERKLANVLRLRRGDSGEILFPQAAQEILHEAFGLKRDRGYSMKQIIQHFNGTSQVNEPVAPSEGTTEHESPRQADEASRPRSSEHSDSADIEIVPTAALDTDEGLPSAESRERWTALVQHIGGAIESAVDGAVQCHSERLENAMTTLCSSIQTLAQRDEQRATEALAIRERNEELSRLCAELGRRLSQLEERAHEEEQSDQRSLGTRLWNWFFGIRPQSSPNDDFVRHFERFRPVNETRRNEGDWYLDYLGPSTMIHKGRCT